MQLADYLRYHDRKVSREGAELVRLAGAVGYSPYTLYMIALGHKRVAPHRAPDIERETKGKVTAAEVCPNFPWPRAA